MGKIQYCYRCCWNAGFQIDSHSCWQAISASCPSFTNQSLSSREECLALERRPRYATATATATATTSSNSNHQQQPPASLASKVLSIPLVAEPCRYSFVAVVPRVALLWRHVCHVPSPVRVMSRCEDFVLVEQGCCILH